MIRAVLDANVLTSAVISSKGSPASLVFYQHERGMELVVTEAILEEMERVSTIHRLSGSTVYQSTWYSVSWNCYIGIPS